MKTMTIEIDIKNDLSGLVKRIWNKVNEIELTISNREGKKVGFPAIYGAAAVTLFPVISLATIYSLVNSELKIAIEKGN